MTPRFWIGDSCTGSSFVNHAGGFRANAVKLAEDRQAYLERLEHAGGEIWPFVHCCVESWVIDGVIDYTLDPLVIPLARKLNQLGVKTISSCQGWVDRKPHILFVGNMESAVKAQRLASSGLGLNSSPFDMPIIALECNRQDQGGQGWSIYFHDTLSLMAWNERNGITIAEQLSNRPKFLNETADIEEIEGIVRGTANP